MHRFLFAAFILVVLVPDVRAQTRPTSAPVRNETLAQGTVAYTPPADWRFLGVRPDDRGVGYLRLDGLGQIVVTVTPQPQSVPDSLGAKLATQLQQTIRDEAAKGNIQIVTPPKVEVDKRFLLKMHDRFKAQGKSADRVQFYQGVGRNLVSVVSTAFSDDPDQSKTVHDLAEQVMLSVKLNRPRVPATTRPVAFAQAHLRVAPPAGWTAEATGNATGTIVSWHDPDDMANLITLTYRTIPASAKNDSATKTLAVQQLALGEKPQFQMPGAKIVGQTRTLTDARFLHKTQTDYDVEGVKLRVTFRQVRAGDGVASITNIALRAQADTIDALADKVATETKYADGN